MDVPIKTIQSVLQHDDLLRSLLNSQSQSKSSGDLIKMIGRVSKEFTPIAKEVWNSSQWKKYREAQRVVQEIWRQIGVDSCDWTQILECLVSCKDMPDVVNDLIAAIIRQFERYGVEHSCTRLSRETKLEIIQALVDTLEAHTHNLILHVSIFRIMSVLYDLRREEGLEATDRMKAHMKVAMKFLTRSKKYKEESVVHALAVIVTINRLSPTALWELTESGEIDPLTTILGTRLRYCDYYGEPRILTQCTQLLRILVHIPRVSWGPMHTPSRTAEDLILGYMKMRPGEQVIHKAECRGLDALLNGRVGTVFLTPENLSFVSDMIQDQHMNMNGPEYNTQEYVLWKLVEACIDMDTPPQKIDYSQVPANVPQSLYDTLQSCFPIDFLLRTLVYHTFTAKPESSASGAQLLERSTTIFRVCKLIRFQTQYVPASPCALGSRQRFVEKNGISVFMDVLHWLPKQQELLWDIYTKYACIDILLYIFAENEAVLQTALMTSVPYVETALRQFAYGPRGPQRTTSDLATFLIGDFLDTDIATRHVFGRMYIRMIRDTIHLLWVFVKSSHQFSEIIRGCIGNIIENVCFKFRCWHSSTDATDSCPFQQKDDLICIQQLVWYFDDMVCKVAFNEDMIVVLQRYVIEGLENYIETTRQYRSMFLKIHYVVNKARCSALEIPPHYNEPSFPPT